MKRKLLLLASLVLGTGITYAQCPLGASFGTGTAPTPGNNVTITTCAFGGEYSTVNSVVTGNDYTITYTGGTGNYLTLFDSGFNPILWGPSPLSFTATASGTYYSQVNVNAACATESACHVVNWANTSPPPPCPGITAPFVEDFETFVATTANTTQNCWVTAGAGSYSWDMTASGTTPSSGTGALAANSGTHYFFTEASSGAIGDIATLTSPDIDLGTVSAPTLRYYYHMFGAQTGTLNVQVSDDNGVTWNTVQTITGAQQTSQADPFWESTASLAAYSGIIKVRFQAVGNGTFEGDICIDDVEIFEPDPVDFEMTSLDNLPANACGLGLEDVQCTVTQVGSVGLVAGDTLFLTYDDGTNLIIDTVVLTGPLGPGAQYSHIFSQQVDFSAVGTYNMDVSVASSAEVNFTNNMISASVINFLQVSSFPYSEDFEGGQGSWIINNSGNGASNGTWAFGTPAHTVMNSASSGVNAFSTGNLTGSYMPNDDSWVISPCFDLTAGNGDEWIGIDVWWESESSWDGMNITYSTDGGATWNLLGTTAEPYNWYNGTSIGTPGGYNQSWVGSGLNGSGEWVRAVHALPSDILTSSSTIFHVNFGSDGSVNYEGASFDNIDIASPPTFNPFNDTVSICDTILGSTMDPGLWDGYLWDTGETTRYSADNTPGLHWVEVYNHYGFPARDTFFVDTFYQAVVPNLEDTRVLCYPDNTVIDAGSDNITTYTYLWNDGSTGQTLATSTAGTYYVTKTDASGNCVMNDTIEIVVAQVNLGPSVVGFCTGNIPTLDAGPGGVEYQWTSGEETQTITPTSAGSYAVTVLDTNGCLLIDVIDLVESIPVVDLGANTTICVNHTITLDAGNPGASYLWSNATTGQTLVVDGAAVGVGTYNYSVTVTDSIGCTGNDAITIVVDPCLGIEELAGVEMNIFPNPSNGVFNYAISGETTEEITFVITDAAGRVVATQKAFPGNGVIDLSNAENGVYIITITVGENSSSARLLKQ